LPRPEFFIGAVLVAAAGFIDDCSARIPVLLRLAVQTISAGIVVTTSGGLPQMPLPFPLDIALGLVGIPLGIFWIVLVTNIYNFLDGIDGFAGLQGTIAGLSMTLMASLEGSSPMGVMGLAISGSCAGFLVHNWHPARIFMGDVGSETLGFVFAALPFEVPAANRGTAVFSTVLFLWFFLSDGVVTILHRMKRGERLWQAHHSHLYQRLVDARLRHDQVTFIVLGPGAVLAGSTLMAIHLGGTVGRWAILAGALTAVVLYQHLTVLKHEAFKKLGKAAQRARE
jgi:UDP-N-acetylmuramyl pentapeptide phosphotransferase/UDP-N-acetylglucosamine-1-phosphate transferase